jgi:hypothetical protein
MRKNYFNHATHIGNQPVRVLKWNVAHALEYVHPDFPTEFHTVLERHGLKPCIAYDYSEHAILDPGSPDQLVPFVDQNKQITIQETFLSMVWAMCYSHLALFEEQNSKPILNRIYGHNHAIDQRAIQNAVNIYRYGVSLVRNYTPWDKTNLPNPEEYDSADLYIEKANSVFVLAMVFILCHEFAHIDRGHLDNYIPKADRPLAESEADERAVQIMLRGATDLSKKVNFAAGMVLGFCSLLTLQSELASNTHPHLAQRIEGVLRAQKLDDISPLWGIATMSFKLWDELHNKTNPRIQWPQGAETFKELFYHIVNQLR